MKPLKTSISSPLYLSEVHLGDGLGMLGLTLCPGKKDPGYGWDRDLEADLAVVARWGAGTVLSLIEDHEFRLLKVEAMGHTIRALGMDWIHLPIRDLDVPAHQFEDGWRNAGPLIHARLEAGERVAIHCRGGIGRTGLVAALILVERGWAGNDAIQHVRAVRPRAVETRAQERYVRDAASRIVALDQV